MALMEHLAEYVRACFTGIWIESHEQQDALVAIMQLCQQEAWQLATWNIEQGLRVSGAAVDNNGSDPLAALRAVNSLATPEGTAPVAALGYRGSAAKRGSGIGRLITMNLLCQGTPVGSKASQPVPPNAVNHFLNAL